MQPGPPAPSGGTNGFAVASLIFGILGGILFSVVFGIVALGQIKRRNQSGKGMAVAGLVLSGVWLLVIVVGIGAAICRGLPRRWHHHSQCQSAEHLDAAR